MDKNVFPTLEEAINKLLQEVEINGEFGKYVNMLNQRQEKEQKELRKRERERKRIEMGDEYESDGDAEDDSSDVSSDYYTETES